MDLRKPMTGMVMACVLATGALAGGADPEARPRPDAAGEGRQEAPAREADGEEAGADAPLRFTNDDLPRLRPEDRGTPSPPAAGEEEAEEGTEGADLDSPMTALQEEAVALRQAATRRRIAALEARLQHLQARLKSVQNPLLRGVTAAGEEEREAVGGLSNEEQLTWVKEQIEATEQALEEARAALTGLLRR